MDSRFHFDGVHCMVCGGVLAENEKLICASCEVQGADPAQAEAPKKFSKGIYGCVVELPDPSLRNWREVGDLKQGEEAFIRLWSIYMEGGKYWLNASAEIKDTPVGLFTTKIRREDSTVKVDLGSFLNKEFTPGEMPLDIEPRFFVLFEMLA